MPLRDQPYIPLYIQDYLTDEKLNMCSAASQGVYIKIMCVLHKQKEYGALLFKQNTKQNSSTCSDFASIFVKLLPFDYETILNALIELVDEEVLIIEGNKIYQKRMVKDAAISEARSKAGKSGGGNPKLFKQKGNKVFKQKPKQNTENDNENESENESVNENEIVNEVYKDAVKFYFSFYEEKIDIKPTFDAGDGKHMKEILAKIVVSLKSKDQPINKDSILNAFKALYQNLPKFYENKLGIKTINTNYVTIIAEIRKGQIGKNDGFAKYFKSNGW